MTFAIALASLIFFAIGFRLARVAPITSDALALVRSAVGKIADRGRTEEEKERAAREAAILLFGRFFMIVALTGAALVPSALLLIIATHTGIADPSMLMDALISPWLLAIALALFVTEFLIRR